MYFYDKTLLTCERTLRMLPRGAGELPGSSTCLCLHYTYVDPRP